MIDAFEFYDVQKAYNILTSQIDKLNMPVFISIWLNIRFKS